MKRLDEIREREAKATKGPWGISKYCSIGAGEFSNETSIVDAEGLQFSLKEDDEFIAHSRTDIPYLLQRLEAAEVLLVGVKAILKMQEDPRFFKCSLTDGIERIDRYFDEWSL